MGVLVQRNSRGCDLSRFKYGTRHPVAFSLGDVISVVALGMGCFLAYVTVAKLLDPRATLDVLSQVWYFPSWAAVAGFALLIVAEVGLVILLLSRRRRLALALTALFLLAVSASPLLQAITGSSISCGCGGAGAVATLSDHLFSVGRNVVLAAICGLSAFFSSKESS